MPAQVTTGLPMMLEQLIAEGKLDQNAIVRQVAERPEIAAQLSKLRRPVPGQSMNTVKSEQGKEDFNGILPNVSNITRTTMSQVEDAENVFKLFPDIQLAAQIIVSSIISPKDMLGQALNYNFDAGDYNPEMTSQIIDLIREEVNKTYGLEDEIYDIVKDALFMSGSHPKLILPEAAIDHVINNSETVMATESIAQTKLFDNVEKGTIARTGILGNPHKSTRTGMALENIFSYDLATELREPSEVVEKLFTVNSKEYVSMNIHYRDKETEKEELLFNREKVIALATESISITDNAQILKLPEFIEIAAKQASAKALGLDIQPGVSPRIKLRSRPITIATENAGQTKKEKISPEKLSSMVYKNSTGQYKPYSSIPGAHNLKRRSIGRPMVRHLPAECLVPIYMPGDYRRHIGYIMAVDYNGHPLTLDSTKNEFGQGINSIAQNDKLNSSSASLLTDRAKKNLISDNYTPLIAQMGEIYAEIVERDLVERFARGTHGREVEIGNNTELYQIMVSRSLQGRQTRLVYIPIEYVTYFAFNYHRNGVGKSYISDLSNIIGMRAMVLFSRIWAQVRSSISTVKANVHLDPKDPDPQKSIEMIKHLIARSRQQYFPNGLRRVADFTDWIQRAGIEIVFDGHPGLPSTAIDFESRNIEHVKPDDDLELTLRHMCYMFFGLSPETVDTASQSDFATTVQQNGILFSRRIKMLGKVLNMDMTDYVRKLIIHDTVIKAKIMKILDAHVEDIKELLEDEDRTDLESQDNKKKIIVTQKILVDIIERVSVSVPEPDTTSLTNLKNEIQAYEDMLDKVLESFIDAKSLPAELSGEDLSSHIDSLKEAYKGYFMRQFYSENNITPEVFKLLDKDEEGSLTGEINSNMALTAKELSGTLLDLMKRSEKLREAASTDVNNQGSLGEGAGPDYSGSDSGSDSGGGSDNPFASFDEMPAEDEAPPEEDAPEATEDRTPEAQ